MFIESPEQDLSFGIGTVFVEDPDKCAPPSMPVACVMHLPPKPALRWLCSVGAQDACQQRPAPCALSTCVRGGDRNVVEFVDVTKGVFRDHSYKVDDY